MLFPLYDTVNISINKYFLKTWLSSFPSPELYNTQFSPLKSRSHNPLLEGCCEAAVTDKCTVPAASGGRYAVRETPAVTGLILRP